MWLQELVLTTFAELSHSAFFQFGIAEQNMMAAAAGFATTGIIPIVTTFAVFAMRALEQVRLSIAYPRLNVKIVVSHLGTDAGPDGASAQAIEDIAVFRSMPGLVIISPADALEIAQATEAMLNYQGPVYMRTGRSTAPRVLDPDYRFELGRGRILHPGDDVTIVACGVETARGLEAAKLLASEGVSARVVNLSTIKPIDVDLLVRCAAETGAVVTAEDHNVFGGLGSAVAEVLVKTCPVPMEFVGLKDTFGESGEPAELAEKYGLTALHIAAAVRQVINRKQGRS
jgi:transketolase